MNTCNIELTKEELMVVIEGINLQSDMGSVVFSEYEIDEEFLLKELNDIFYKLSWRED